MVKLKVYLELTGENFTLEELLGCQFDICEFLHKGQLASNGRYKGKPVPYTWALLKVPSFIESQGSLKWMLKKLHHCKTKIKSLELYISVAYYYDIQFNWTLDLEEVELLAELNIPFNFSVYQIDSMELQEL